MAGSSSKALIIKGIFVCFLGCLFPLSFPFLAQLKPFAVVLIYRLGNGLAFLVCTIAILICILSSQRKLYLGRKPSSGSQRRSFESVFGDTSGYGVSTAYMYLNSLDTEMEPEPESDKNSFPKRNVDDRSVLKSADLEQDDANCKDETSEDANLEAEATAETWKVKCAENLPVEESTSSLEINSAKKAVDSKPNAENLDVSSDAKALNNLDVNSVAKPVDLKSIKKSMEISLEKTWDNKISSVNINGSLDKTRSNNTQQDNKVLEGNKMMPSPILFNGDRSKVKKTVKRVSFNLRQDTSNDSSDDGSSNDDHFSPVKSTEFSNGPKEFSTVKCVEINSGYSINAVGGLPVVNSTMNPSELDRKAAEFIARVKEQIRLQGVETSPSSRSSRSPAMKLVV